jgi:hypothetical protein
LLQNEVSLSLKFESENYIERLKKSKFSRREILKGRWIEIFVLFKKRKNGDRI